MQFTTAELLAVLVGACTALAHGFIPHSFPSGSAEASPAMVTPPISVRETFRTSDDAGSVLDSVPEPDTSSATYTPGNDWPEGFESAAAPSNVLVSVAGLELSALLLLHLLL